MARETTAAFASAIEAPHIDEVIFAELQFASGTSYVCTREHDVEWNGQTWLGRGKVGSISMLQEAGELEPYGIELTLGVPATPELMAIALDPSEYKNRKVRLWEGLFGPDLVDFRFTEGSLVAEHGADRCTLTVTRAGNTATRVNEQGLIEVVSANTARWTYNPVTLALQGLLREPARTNLVLHSVTPTTASGGFGTDGFATLTSAPDVLGPSGQPMGYFAAGAARYYYAPNLPFVSGTTYTRSVFVKQGDSTSNDLTITMYGQGSVAFASCVVNVATGAVTATIGTARSEYWGNGIWRIQQTGTCTVTGAAGFIDAVLGSLSGGHYVACEQAEAGAFATSYIPTTSSAVTRNKDDVKCSDISGFFNASEGTAVWEGIALDVPESTGAAWPRLFQFDNGSTGTDQISAFIGGGTSQVWGPHVYISPNVGPEASVFLGTISAGVPFRAAISWKAADFAGSLDGGAVATGSSGSVPIGLTTLRLGDGDFESALIIRRFTYYPVRLGNAVLEELSAGDLDPEAAARGRRVVADPAGPFTFKMDTLKFSLGEVAFLKMTAESRLADWQRARVRRWNDADHQAEHPGDDFFKDAENMVEANFVW